MFRKFSNSWELTRQSWSVLRADKHLMVFPLLSSFLTVLVCISFFIPALKVAGFAPLFVLYFVTNVIVTFFNASLIACATARFNGEDSSASAGMKAALRRWPQILG